MKFREFLAELEKEDPIVRSQKNQLVALGRQKEALQKQIESYKTRSQEPPPALATRMEALNKKIHDLKVKLADHLDIPK